MNLPSDCCSSALTARRSRPVRVGLIGAGKFGSMFLSQVPTNRGPVEVAVIADLDPERARAACRTVGWDAGADRRGRRLSRPAARRCQASPMWRSWWRRPAIPPPASPMRRAAIAAGKHIVMVNVEADVLAGPLLARRGARARAWSIRWPMAISRR